MWVTRLKFGLDGLVLLEGLAPAEVLSPGGAALLALIVPLSVLLCSLLALLLLSLLLITLVAHGMFGGFWRW